MSIMKVTVLGLETYLHNENKSLFDLAVFPEGINKEDTINNILLQGGEFESLYSDPYFMQSAIGNWARKHYRTFDKWIKALNIDYNPLENYDRDESWWDYSKKDNDNTRTLDHQDKRTLDTQNKRTLDTQDEETRDISDKTTYDKTTSTVNEVSAFDSSSYQPADQSTMDEDGTVTVDGTGTDTFTHTGTDTLDNTGTDTVDYSGTIKDEGGETVDSSHGGRIHGNIGVTTSQQMLQSELDISRWNIIEQITDLFITEFCIMVYD